MGEASAITKLMRGGGGRERCPSPSIPPEECQSIHYLVRKVKLSPAKKYHSSHHSFECIDGHGGVGRS